MTSLTTFSFFPKLPLDLRICIWQLLLPPSRIVLIKEKVHPTAPLENEYEYELTANDISIQALNSALKQYKFFTNKNQTQLESYSFSSSNPAPPLPTDTEIKYARQHHYETTRQGALFSTTPVPIISKICSESRSLLKSYGYTLAFATPTDTARIWFSYKKDVLYFNGIPFDDEELVKTIDGWNWNVKRSMKYERRRVRKLALRLQAGQYYNRYWVGVPTELGRAVRLFEGLEEVLLVVEDWWFEEDEGKRGGDWNEMAVAVDKGVEEAWGHRLYWEPDHESPDRMWVLEFKSPAFVEGVLADGARQLKEAAEFVEKELREHLPLTGEEDETEWKNPKVRYVILMGEGKQEGFLESRKRYKRYIGVEYRHPGFGGDGDPGGDHSLI